MQRIIVDLPEPDGPQITMRSPPITLRSMSRSTWKSPYHLLTRASSIAIGVLSLLGFKRDKLLSLIASLFHIAHDLVSTFRGHARLSPAARRASIARA